MRNWRKLERIERTLRATTVVPKDVNRQRVHRFAKKLTSQLDGRAPLFVIILDGACRFSSDLLGHSDNWFRVEVAYVKASSYRDIYPEALQFDSLGLDQSRVKGRDVVILEDIIDTGQTISAVSEFVLGLDPRTLQIAALIDKKGHRLSKFDVTINHVVHDDLEDGFFVGYGMDFMNLFRPMNHISILPEDVRKEIVELLAAAK